MAGAGFAPRPYLVAREFAKRRWTGCPRSTLGYPYGAWREPTLTPLGLYNLPENRFFSQCLGCLKPMRTTHDERLAIAPDGD
jgi:hypothetical protein